MNTICNLADKQCKPCEGGMPPLTHEEVVSFLKNLNSNWRLSEDKHAIRREFTFKNFSKTVYFMNMMVWLADHEAHHPDIEFGYGYCHVTFTTHAVEGLSENDFICASKVDQIIEMS